MGKVKKKGAKGGDKSVAKAAKKEASKEKALKKGTKKSKKGKGKDDDDDMLDEADFLRTLEDYRKQWELEHLMTEETVDGPPSRRANCTLTPCPVRDALWLFGGDYLDNSTSRITTFSDLYRFTPANNEWRRFTSPTSPSPRSAHAAASSPAQGGKLFIFGGEFSSSTGSSFFHHRDLWSYSITAREWERIDTKVKPTARSGARMALWKHWLFLHGGFNDVGVRTSYLSDTWVFDTRAMKWTQLVFDDRFDRKPTARSGFSWLPTADGLVLHGGYSKVYENKRVTGVSLADTWFLRIPPLDEHGDLPRTGFKWERRKKIGFAPPVARSGCTMALWTAKGMGVLFGGVTDEDKDEESLDSTFYNDCFGYNLAGTGRWVSFPLKRPKKKGGAGQARKQKKKLLQQEMTEKSEVSSSKAGDEHRKDEDEGSSDEEGTAKGEDGSDDEGPKPWEIAAEEKRKRDAEAARAAALEKRREAAVAAAAARAEAGDGDGTVDPKEWEEEEKEELEDPEVTRPRVRYNSMLAVIKNTLYIYGGIFETGSREYTLDDFHTLQLDKLDRFECLKEATPFEDLLESDSSSDEDEDEDGSEDEHERDDEEEDGTGYENNRPDAEDEEDEEMVPVEGGVADLSLATEDPAQTTASKAELRKRAAAFMAAQDAAGRSNDDVISTPQVGETLNQFFDRSRDYWTRKAYGDGSTDNVGKELRRDGFKLAEDAYKICQPVLEEIKKMQEEAGIGAEDISKTGRASGAPGNVAESRNRR